MSKFKENGLFRTIFSLLKSKDQKSEQPKSDENEFNKNGLVEKNNVQNIIWKKDYNPLRSVILWGYDNSNNPSFLILLAISDSS